MAGTCQTFFLAADRGPRSGRLRAGPPPRTKMLLLRRSARSARVACRPLCTSAPGGSGPLLPQWGSFGKSQEQILALEAELRADGAKAVALQIQVAELAQRTLAMLTQPFQYFGDPEWRTQWLEGSREPRERYARIHNRMLDGCESAYEALLAEFTSEEPEFDLYVKSGALDPELARYLSDAAEKYRSAGRRPVIDVARVNAQVRVRAREGGERTWGDAEERERDGGSEGEGVREREAERGRAGERGGEKGGKAGG